MSTTTEMQVAPSPANGTSNGTLDDGMGETYVPQTWLALVLSLLSPGLGQVYCGALGRGLVCLCIGLLYVPVVATVSLVDIPSVNLTLIIVASLLFLAVYVFALLDTLRLASRRKLNTTYSIGLAAYGLMVFVGFMNPLVSIFLLRNSVFEVFYVPTSSMVPNVVAGDYLMANKLFARSKLPQRGELVIFRPPKQRTRRFIKRVIGLPGDTVEVKGHEVWVNDRQLERDPLPYDSVAVPLEESMGKLYEEVNSGARYKVLIDESRKPIEFAKQTVPDGAVFVLGDYRTKSKDSRAFSFVPLGEIEGRMQSIIYPSATWKRFGAF